MKYVPILNKISISTSELIKEKIEEETQALNDDSFQKEDSIMNYIILTANQQNSILSEL